MFVYSFVCVIPMRTDNVCERTVIAANYDDAISRFEESMGQIEFDNVLNTRFQIMEPAKIEFYQANKKVQVDGTFAFVDGYVCITYKDTCFHTIIHRCKKLENNNKFTAVVYSGDYTISPKIN